MNDKFLGLFFRPTATTIAEEKLDAFLDRLLLRVYTSTSLLSSLHGATVHENKIQIVFNKLPVDVISKVVQIIGVPTKVFEFKSKDHQHELTGFEATPGDMDLAPL